MIRIGKRCKEGNTMLLYVAKSVPFKSFLQVLIEGMPKEVICPEEWGYVLGRNPEETRMIAEEELMFLEMEGGYGDEYESLEY